MPPTTPPTMAPTGELLLPLLPGDDAPGCGDVVGVAGAVKFSVRKTMARPLLSNAGVRELETGLGKLGATREKMGVCVGHGLT